MNQKLAMKYFDPFQISTKIGKVAHKIMLHEGLNITFK